ncbi:uncharacterized protein LOC112342111 [Selaginella moellendorffii]|uniref:uncharacterized protein LOC112342111 n=1 Tax=Selaginella moellendorffii TaxID=88036 RepID=UPI000D1C63DB|nr:uncharacterized protein LOC112342111 [Selaginella moellendorffii]|eukprot:XP_024519168.1 uncharacterized protein LOC112342111 [Selaginella moellendorffii]
MERTMQGLPEPQGYMAALASPDGQSKSSADGNLYIYFEGEGFLFLVLYVDDIASNQVQLIHKIKTYLSAKFEMVDLGELHYCLGIQVRHNKRHEILELSQEKYILDVLQRYSMLDANLVATPMPAGLKLSKASTSETYRTAGKAPELSTVRWSAA